MNEFAKNCITFTVVMILVLAIYSLAGRALDQEYQNQDAVIEQHKLYLAQSEQPSIIWTRREDELQGE